jgi:FG-GAP repeat protein
MIAQPRLLVVCCLSSALLTGALAAQHAAPPPGPQAAVGDPATVRSFLRMEDLRDPFQFTLGESDRFGTALAPLGDLDGNGDQEHAIGAPGDFQDRGAVWIFSLRPNRSVAVAFKYGPLENLPFVLDPGDLFGSAVTAIGDVNGDGVNDVAVGAPGDDDGTEPPFSGAGAVWILFLGLDGNIQGHLKFSRTAGGFSGLIEPGDRFGSALAPIGDLDGNGVPDLLVGASGDNDGGNNRGAVWVLFFAPDNTVLAAQKISQTEGGFGGSLTNGDGLGASLAVLGDLSGDGTPEVAVGASSVTRGDVWVLSLSPDGTVASELRTATFDPLGSVALANLGDVDLDGGLELAVGDVHATHNPGSEFVHVLHLDTGGNVLSINTITPPTIPRVGLVTGDFGRGLAGPGDTDGDGKPELMVGVPELSNRAVALGGLVLLELAPTGAATGEPILFDPERSGIPAAPENIFSSSSDYGSALARLGDMDQDGLPELAVGSADDDDGGDSAGAVWLHYLTPTGGTRVRKLSVLTTSLLLEEGHRFGSALANVGDLDGNGVVDLAVGAAGDGAGVVWVLFLNRSANIVAQGRIEAAEAGLDTGAGGFGSFLLPIGDLDLDGVIDLVAGDRRDQVNPLTRVLFLASDGSVKASRTIERDLVTGTAPGDGFGRLVADLGPRANGGRILLLAGKRIPGPTPTNNLWRVELDASGQITASLRVVRGFMTTLASPGDLDGDGNWDLAFSGDQFVSFTEPVFLQLVDASLNVLLSRQFNRKRVRSLTALGDTDGDGVTDLGGAGHTGAGQNAWIARLGGNARVDFEKRDTADDLGHENGRALSPEVTGFSLELTGTGANLGPAVFESTLGGPNAGSQDGDLLVGSGKVLMLQDSLHGQQTEPGIFDHPNDDADGGTFALEPHAPVRALSIRMIDIDPGLGQGATVRLFDQAGLVRTFDVPAGFTEDRVLNGGSGWRRLDLTSLAPQAGFQAQATAAQSNGFDERKVVRIEVTLGSSGAIDALVYDPYP